MAGCGFDNEYKKEVHDRILSCGPCIGRRASLDEAEQQGQQEAADR